MRAWPTLSSAGTRAPSRQRFIRLIERPVFAPVGANPDASFCSRFRQTRPNKRACRISGSQGESRPTGPIRGPVCPIRSSTTIRDALKDLSRRTFLKGTAGAALGGSALSLLGRPALAADLKTVRFSEAVHNLGYINLYVGMHSIFKKNGLDMQVSAAGGDTQTFAAVLGGSADFAIGDATMAVISRENGGPGMVVGTVVQRAHYFAVSNTVEPFTDPKSSRAEIATSPSPTPISASPSD